MPRPDGERQSAAHRESGERAMFAVGSDAIIALHKRNQIGEQILLEIGALLVAGDACMPRIRVGERHDDDHRRGFLFGDQVVENQVGAAELRPRGFIAVGAVQQIENGQPRRWSARSSAACRRNARRVVPVAFDG